MAKISKCVIFGGTGFVGSNFAQKLSPLATEIVVVTRNIERNKSLKMIPNLKLVPASISDSKSIRDILKNAEIVVNTVGILNEFDQINTFENIHFKFLQRLSQEIKVNKIKRFLHISSLNAKADQISDYLHTKGKAEDFILNEMSSFCNTTIFRPSIVFGEEDSFFNKFAKLLKFIPIFPLACPSAKFQPIYVGDLTDYMINCISDIETYNEKVDMVGPRTYTFSELIKLTTKTMGVKRIIIPLNDPLSKIQAYVFQNLPGKLFTIDNYHSLQIDSVSENGYVGKTTVEQKLSNYLNIKDKSEELRKKAGRKK